MDNSLALVAEVDVGPVFRAAEERRPFGGVLAPLHVGYDLDRHVVAEVLLEPHLAVCAAGEVVSVRRPRTRIAALCREPGVIRDAADVLPCLGRIVVRLQEAGVADSVKVHDKIVLRGVVRRFVLQRGVCRRRGKRGDDARRTVHEHGLDVVSELHRHSFV